MDTMAELHPDENSAAAAAADSEAVEKTDAEAAPSEPAVSIPEPAAALRQPAGTEGDGERAQPRAAPPRLELLPTFASREAPRSEASVAKTRRNFAVPGLAAALALLVLVGAGAVYERTHETAQLAAKVQENQSLASTVSNLTERLDAIEAARAREENADARKLLGELKQTASATRDISAAIAQLTTRVDHVERDQGARLDKLAERIDHDSSPRFADLAARLDKLEKKAATPAPVVASVAPTPPKPTAATPPPPAKAEPGVSSEATGSIEKPKPPLRGYAVVDMRDGFATIEGREGMISVAPGDSIPGLGRVLRIERRGREWVVVTSLGVIEGGTGPY